MKPCRLLFSLCLSLLTAGVGANAKSGVALENKQGTVLPVDSFTFQDETNQTVALGKYFHQKKPVVLAFVYYDCPGACTMLLNGMIAGMTPHIYVPGRDFELVVVSIDPKDTPVTAAKKRSVFLNQYGRPDSALGLHFLTTTSVATIQSLTNQMGFHYEYNSENGMFNHPSALFFLTPAGTLSTELVGIDFKSADFRKAITDAATGRFGTFVERLNSICLSYLPHQGWLDRPSHWAILFLGMIALLSLLAFIAKKKRPRLIYATA